MSYHLYIVMCTSFFFYRYADHRDLHSFPTRRSSDLDMRTNFRPIARAMDRPSDVFPTPGGPTRQRIGPSRDRKSTRLNSSHANISYAVFCLKKKKNKNKPKGAESDTPTYRPPASAIS